MGHLQCHLKGLSSDLLEDIMARLDGSTLASVACTCSEIKGISRGQQLWRKLCHSTWPSTALPEAQYLVSSIQRFERFYADSYPLISIDKDANVICTEPNQISPSNFASFVDVYYKNKCVLSRVLDGLREAVDMSEHDGTSGLRRGFLNCPFSIELLDIDQDANNPIRIASNGYHYNSNNYDEILAPPFKLLAEGGESTNYSKDLAGLRLSWVVLDKKQGRAVNLSSWKPMLVKKSWPSDCDYLINFGCIIPAEGSKLPYKLAKCLITARCRLMGSEGHLRWIEICMCFKDLTGAQVGKDQSLIIMNRALSCLRTTNHLKVERAYHQFERQQREITRINKLKEALADWLCVSIEVAIFVTLVYLF